MADLRITCPHCRQDIECDELWVGHELQCPICQASFTVQAPATPKGPAGNSLVPKPPPGGAPRLSVGQAQVPAQTGRNIPIRNLTGPPPKKKSPLISILAGVLVVAALGVGGYFGFGWIKEKQDKAKAKSAAELRNSDGGEAGHIANLNKVLDATEPGGAGLASLGSGNEQPRARAPRMPDSGAAPSGPITPPKYTLDVAQATIPQGPVNGMISGTNFVAESARLDFVGTAPVLRFLQGEPTSPDREMFIYLRLKAGERLGGQSVTISNDMKGAGLLQVAKRWKANPMYPPTMKTFNFGYALKLELGQATNETIPGKIFLALPDTEQSVIGGVFTAAIHKPDPSLQPAAYSTPVTTPTTPTTTPAGMDPRYRNSRYGTPGRR